MKTVCVIPARYASTRIPGKVLADICGRPMVWWVHRQAKEVKEFEKVIVAADDIRTMDICKKYGIEAIMTSPNHEKHIDRLHEVSQKIKADLYVCVCCDEPLVKPETISKVIPRDYSGGFFVQTLIREFDDPAEALDPSKMKVVANAKNECLLITRSMAPFPYKSISFKFLKLIGIECFSRSALDFFVNRPTGFLEGIEEITLLRYIENHKPVNLVLTTENQIGVDTPKDLEKVREIIRLAVDRGEVDLSE